jgi:hypothetical protein
MQFFKQKFLLRKKIENENFLFWTHGQIPSHFKLKIQLAITFFGAIGRIPHICQNGCLLIEKE